MLIQRFSVCFFCSPHKITICSLLLRPVARKLFVLSQAEDVVSLCRLFLSLRDEKNLFVCTWNLLCSDPLRSYLYYWSNAFLPQASNQAGDSAVKCLSHGHNNLDHREFQTHNHCRHKRRFNPFDNESDFFGNQFLKAIFY